jgi:heme A synthase
VQAGTIPVPHPKEPSSMTTIATTRNQPTANPRRPIWPGGVLAGLTGAATLGLYGVLAQAAGVPMRAASPGAAPTQPITPGTFAMGVLVCTFWGTVLAVVLARRATRPRRTWTRVSTTLVAISLLFPLAAGQTAMSTKLTLVVGHLIAAVIVIPLLARRLARENRAEKPGSVN